MLLLKKMLRDLLDSSSQFISIFLMILIGVLVFSGLDTIQAGLRNDTDEFYKETNLADMWVSTVPLYGNQLEEVGNISGVDKAQSRMKIETRTENTDLKIYALATNEISTPYFMSGKKFDTDSSGIWLANGYAVANGYSVGDSINVNGNNLEVMGLVLNSESIYYPSIDGSVNDFKNYGDAYISDDTARTVFGSFLENEIVLKTNTNDSIELQNEIENNLGNSYLISYDRQSNISVNSIDERIKQFNIFAYVFPFLFFFLAILTIVTTMRRIIDNQKQQIGILMSQGYSPAKITRHYLSYGIWISLLAVILGLIFGPYLIPSVIHPLLESIYEMPKWSTPLTIPSIISACIIVVLCVLAIVLSIIKTLKIKPAQILNNVQNSKAKHHFFEKMDWFNKLSFESKSTLRNIFSNKIRSVMAIVGVLGCMVLVLAGLGMKTTISYDASLMYSGDYKSKIVLNDSTLTPSDLGIEDVNSTTIVEGIGNIEQNHIRQQITYTVRDNSNIATKNDIYDNRIIAPETGVVMSDYLAKILDVKKSDVVEFRIPGGKWEKVEITSIVKTPLPLELTFSKTSWDKLNNPFNTTAILVDEESKQITDLEDTPKVSKVVLKQELEESVDVIVQSTNAIVFVLIISAITLGITILYNLGFLNLSEMSREYATLKVLGLYPKEIRRMAAIENLILSLIGYLIGIILGINFLNFFMSIVSNETIAFYSHFSLTIFVIATLVSLGCSIGVNLYLSRNINKIDMVMSLKSNE